MSLFSLVLPLTLPLNAVVAFLAGGAAGILMTRTAQSHRAGPMLSFVDPDSDATTAPAPEFDDPTPWSDAAVLERPALGTRTRTGRLPLPYCVTSLTPTDEPALALVNVFVDRLAELPYQGWLDIGRAQLADAARVSPRATTFAIHEATNAAHRLCIAAWYARDAVETSVFLATSDPAQWSADERRVIASAHGAAEYAALALLARDALAPTDFATLFAPFDHVMSSDHAPRTGPSGDSEG
jgi:hypothetical protein